MVAIPEITTQTIINYCGKKMYYAAKQFLQAQAFYIYYKEWMVLKAVCEGTSNPSYFVKVIFNEKRVAHSSCTCPNNKTAPCKHIAALLMMWTEDPQRFRDKTQWMSSLKKEPKKELVSLIEKMVDLYPDSNDTYCSINYCTILAES